MKLNFAKAIKDAQRLAAKHSPEILMGIGIGGMITTTILAVRATPKAVRLMEDAKKEQEVEKLKPLDTVKATWKCYIPAAVTGVGSVACLICSQKVNAKRNAALAAAYKLSETALTEYREQVVETFGEAKEKVIHEKIAEKQIEAAPITEHEIIRTKRGTTRCYDPLSDRYFYSDLELIRRAENTINEHLLHSICGEATINDFYDELDLPHTDLGDRMGWNTDMLVKLHIGSMVANDGKPVIVMGHEHPPRYLGY